MYTYKNITNELLENLVNDIENTVITMTTSKGTFKYNHDSIYNEFQEKFDTMNCFIKYGNYTNSNVIPAFARHLEIKE